MVLDFMCQHRLMVFLMAVTVVIVVVLYLQLRIASWIFRKGRVTTLKQLKRDGLLDLRNRPIPLRHWGEHYDIRLRLYYRGRELYTF